MSMATQIIAENFKMEAERNLIRTLFRVIVVSENRSAMFPQTQHK